MDNQKLGVPIQTGVTIASLENRRTAHFGARRIAWIFRLLMACSLIVIMLNANNENATGTMWCFLALAIALSCTLATCLECIWGQVAMMRELRDTGISIGHWRVWLIISIVFLAPGVALESAIFLLWYRNIIGREPSQLKRTVA